MTVLVAFLVASTMTAGVIHGLKLSAFEFRTYLAHQRRCERVKRRPKVRKRWSGRGVVVGSVVK